MVPDIGYISAGHSPATVPTMTEAAVLEGTPHIPLPATTAANATLWMIDDLITTCAVKTTGIAAPHPALATSPAGITHTTPQTRTSLTQATPTIQHRNFRPEMPNNAQDLQHPINLTV